MKPFTFSEVAQSIGAPPPAVSVENLQVTGACVDSRKVQPGDLFFALFGERTDGHHFVLNALEQGAMGAVVQHIPNHFPEALFERLLVVESPIHAFGKLAKAYRRCHRVKVIAITGSTGKTSVKEWIAAALEACEPGVTLKTEGNYNTEIGVPLTLFQLSDSHKYAVLEMGMRGPCQIDWLCEIAEPDIGVITQIGWSHIELVGGTREGIANAKAELLRRLPPDGIAVLPKRDDFYDYLHSECRCPVFTFAIEDLPLEIQLPIMGEHQRLNAAAALAVVRLLGYEQEKILHGFQSVQMPDMRMSLSNHPDGWTLLNDAYNANPDSMRAAVLAFVSMPCEGQRVALLGDMKELGDFSTDHHQSLGRWLAQQPLNWLVLVGPEMLRTAQAAKEGGFPSDRILHVDCTKQLRGWIKEHLRPGDSLLLKGSRAMEMENAL